MENNINSNRSTANNTIHPDVIKKQRFLNSKITSNSFSMTSKIVILVFAVLLPSLFYGFHYFDFNDRQCYSILYGFCGSFGFIASLIAMIKTKNKGERFWFFLTLSIFSFIIYAAFNKFYL